MKVPFLDLTRQYQSIRTEIEPAVLGVLNSGSWILGEEVEAFEKEMADYLEVEMAIAVASGTDALWLALKALGVGAGDKVVTTPFTFFATVSAILNTGAEPIFADILPSTFNLDPQRVEDLLESPKGKNTKVILPVHLYGQMADMTALMDISHRYHLHLVEDAAQAMGADHKNQQAGTFGDIGCFSFYPTKNLGGFGDGGLLITHNRQLGKQLRMLRCHGAKAKYHHHLIGSNSRLDAVHAAALRIKLKYLDTWISERQHLASVYEEASQSLQSFLTPPFKAADCSHAYHQYTMRVNGGRRDQFRSFLSDRGIQTAVYYPVPNHLQPALAHLGFRTGDFPEAEKASREVVSLPIFPELTMAEREFLLPALQEWS